MKYLISLFLIQKFSRGETSDFGVPRSYLGNPIRYSPFIIPLLFVISCLLFVAPHSAHAGGLALPPNNLGLVAFWPLNEGSGTVTSDASGKSNSGTLANGPAWANGKAGKGVVFDGGDDVITAGTQDTLFTENGAITISAWIYARSYGGGSLGRIVDRSTTVDGPCFQFVLGKLYFQIDGATDLIRSGGTAIPLNQWVYVTATWDGSTNASNVKLYINGVEDSYVDNTSGASLNDNSSATFRIGNSASGVRGFDGTMDEVRIYNRVLTSTEILSLYKNSQQYFINGALTNTGLVGYWSLNDGSGTIATDFSGKRNDGTLVSSPTWVNGKFGNSLRFSGSNYVSISDNPSIRPSSITVSAWIKANSVTTGVRAGFVSKWFLSALWGYSIETGLASCNNGAGDAARTGIKFMFRSTATASDFCAFSNLSEIPGTWQHVVGTFDQSSGDAKIYIDGALISTVDKAPGTLHQPLSPLGIGAINDSGSWGKYFNGTIDEVRIYNRTLSDAEVATLYNKSRLTIMNKSSAVVSSGLVGWWTMDGGDTNWATGIATDKSASGYNGNFVRLATTTGPTVGKVGQAMNFNGDNYIAPNSVSSAIQTGSASYSFWFRPKATILNGSDKQSLVSLGETVSNNDLDVVLGGDPSAGGVGDGKIYFVHWNGSAFVGPSTTQATWVANTWYHITAVYDAAAGSRIYVNGVLDGSDALTNRGTTPYSTFFAIGATPNYTLKYYASGAIDDMRVYNRTLSVSEALQLYRQGK